MTDGSLKLINEKEPSTLAKIVMEVEQLNEKEKLVMLRQVRMRKALLMAEKLKGWVKPNKITFNKIVAEQRAIRKERKKHAQSNFVLDFAFAPFFYFLHFFLKAYRWLLF